MSSRRGLPTTWGDFRAARCVMEQPTLPCGAEVERALETSRTDPAPLPFRPVTGHAVVSRALREVLSQSRWTARQGRREEATRRILRPLEGRADPL